MRTTRIELSNARLMARAWASTSAYSDSEALAASFAGHALASLAATCAISEEFCPSLRRARRTLDETAMALATKIGEIAARLPLIEALHQVTSLYPALMPAKERSALGAFYTPPALVTRLLDQAAQAGVDWSTAKVLDPAAGGGIFLLHAARRMVDALGECEPVFALSHVTARLSGFELDANAANLAQCALEISLADLARSAGRPAPQIVKTCDTLAMQAQPVFDLVIGNPPYGRVTLPTEMRAKYARSLYGHANLYGIFTDAAMRWTKPGGIIAFLTPTSFLGGQYFSALRCLLAKEAPPVAIDFVHARKGVFEDVLQETLLAIYHRGALRGGTCINYLTMLSEIEARITSNGAIILPQDASAPWLAPRLPDHIALVRRAQRMSHRLSDWGYKVSTGPLVWNRHKSQLRDRAGGKNVHPLIWAEAVTPDGRFTYRAHKKNHAPFFRMEPGDDWLLTRKPCVVVQRTTAKEQTRRLIAAELPAAFIAEHGGVVIENHLNMVRAVDDEAVAPSIVAAFLNSRIADDLFRCISGSVAVSAFELEAVPLPAPSQLAVLSKLVASGASRDEIDTECARLYGTDA
ncbi:RNA methyltransferase [Limoniibacter endophyticus]|uniref:site-specific DNA-methyltransferase (adenine-specific) n=2 Tax=Limoniibacter endophyticus TaxID=1565040 RepID=A0A8J3DIA3_9HYPH|nr:RNA methyltransferase [Limoniibacter endophyticus]